MVQEKDARLIFSEVGLGLPHEVDAQSEVRAVFELGGRENRAIGR